MRVAIIGIGALGSLFAARLHALCELIMCGDWPEQVQAVRHHGLRLIDRHQRVSVHRVRIANDVREVGCVELAFILVKSYKTAQAAALAEQILAPEGLAVTLQNGLGHAEILQAALSPHRVIAGSTSQGATLVRPGVVRHAGEGPTCLAQPALWTPAFDRLLQLFEHAQMEVQVLPEVTRVLWRKLVISAGINSLTALLRQPNGYLVENELARGLMLEAVAEAARVARTQGVALDPAEAGAQALAVARATAGNHSSMLQDVQRGAPTEIEAITGRIVALAGQAGVATPVNNLLLRLMRDGAEQIDIAELIRLREHDRHL
ncbi:MAG: 2-dehydropantoate 2-reductase [candidate division KSB1 bacterium]|nr:2-dehydropantoate 2-reductase [candidate division KSB1 bacterium]MDZ7274954.1 2-dehydropantoate 2-reductase [candidate division KSB1 bacterium]MDZ7286595.1 2-dehydropantoate 2-reductase [candidate division KSB1 bacterium]MDZ7299241.1 2-dehydropantoate 2-reductase [candidate division KSB1 bacterium]MDZ7308902.1 2-dehydropantoate 2-reductase [candidate division KSB1 bacterium]